MIVAVPPAGAPSVIVASLRTYLDATVSDVVSTKARLQHEVEIQASMRPRFARFVPGHPMAGREVSGPAAARADLFADRVWALTPPRATDPRRVGAVAALVTRLGAVPGRDDRRGARPGRRAHLAHAAGGGLHGRGRAARPSARPRCACRGRGCATSPAWRPPTQDLWTEILASNADPRGRGARGPDRPPERPFATGCSAGDAGPAAVRTLARGRGRRAPRVPGKHGSAPVAYAVVPVSWPTGRGARSAVRRRGCHRGQPGGRADRARRGPSDRPGRARGAPEVAPALADGLRGGGLGRPRLIGDLPPHRSAAHLPLCRQDGFVDMRWIEGAPHSRLADVDKGDNSLCVDWQGSDQRRCRAAAAGRPGP